MTESDNTLDLNEIRAASGDFDADFTAEERARRTPGVARRAAGSIVGMAVGDALGAPYEFGPSPGIVLAGTADDMVGGGTFAWAPGEWTDDTSMAVPLLRAFAQTDPADGRAIPTAVVQEWRAWAQKAPDVGNQTRAVLGRLSASSTADDARASARRVHESTGRSGGNGSLMRTAPVGLLVRFSNSGFFSTARTVDAIVTSARELSGLTHYDPDAGDACVLWSVMIHMAVTYGVVDVEDALRCLPESRRDRWRALLAEAADAEPGDFPKNGWVVHALQAAWAAIHRAGFDLVDDLTATPDAFRLALQHAINAGGDTDTVAAITGALAGALAGVDAIPLGWQRRLHGWGGEGVVLTGHELATLAVEVQRNVGSDYPTSYQPTERVDYSAYGDIGVLAKHPHDEGVWIGAVGMLDDLPAGVDAVVSLCRIGTRQVPDAIAAGDRVTVRLIDKEAPGENPHLEFVLTEAADAVAALRAEGKTVLLHCVQAQSRTPTVAALYSMRHLGVDGERAVREVCAALPQAHPNQAFASVLRAQTFTQ
ncbi:ADP-ribosylglycohydrolase family protein [Demequina sp.]|uniref:ADP-ribosylglycohydrolase family protein n=1 Tax=Demequina sp. TaxID=2050685 RepID=UPI0025C16E14|nr:ADP-ribosylglycohydrolase family protein [Demequina sp.]